MRRFSCNAESLIDMAKMFAHGAHGAVGQLRKYTGEPYIIHPAAVVGLVTRPYVNASWEMICAAWLHDVVEDTKVTSQTVHHLFGNDVGRMVDALTNPSKETGTRRERHRMEMAQISAAPAGAQTVRVADIIDNTKDIARLDPSFAERYLEEKMAILLVLDKANPQLFNQAHGQILRAAGELACAC